MKLLPTRLLKMQFNSYFVKENPESKILYAKAYLFDSSSGDNKDNEFLVGYKVNRTACLTARTYSSRFALFTQVGKLPAKKL